MKTRPCGVIKNGNCEREFRERYGREKGVALCWQWLQDNKCVKIKKGWYKIVKMPKKILDFDWVIENVYHNVGGNGEIGWRRFLTDVVGQLYKDKRSFRYKHMELWMHDIASFQLGFGCSPDDYPINEGNIIKPNHPMSVGYAPAMNPHLYKGWKAEVGEKLWEDERELV